MIVDQLENSALYGSLSTRLAAAFNYLISANLNTIEVGKYEIEGSEVFAMVSEYKPKNEADAKWEAHQNYADVQYIVSGEEKLGYAPLETMEIKEAYNPDKDIIILNGSGDYITATPGTFLVFFPHDAHQPCVTTGLDCTVKKVVVKVRV